MNWKIVADVEVVQKFESISKGLETMLSNLDKSIREVRRTTLLDNKSIGWLDFLESSRSQLVKTLKNRNK